MSRQKSNRSRNSKASIQQQYQNIFDHLKRTNLNKKVTRRDHHFKEIKNVSDGFLSQSYFYEKQNRNQENLVNFYENWEKKIEEIIENKLSKVLHRHVEKYVNRIFQDHKMGLELYYQNQFQELKGQVQSVENGYAEMMKNYDSFLKVVDEMVIKTKKIDKFVGKNQFEASLKKVTSEIEIIQEKVKSINAEEFKIKVPQHNVPVVEPKIQPFKLVSPQKSDLSREDLRIVVDTFNENFVRIDEKLKEIVQFIH